MASRSSENANAQVSWVDVRRTPGPGQPALDLDTPRLPAISSDGGRVLIAERRLTLGGVPNLRLVVRRAADETEVASMPILAVEEMAAAESDGAAPERASRGIEMLLEKVRARVDAANRELAATTWIPLSRCSVDDPASVAPRCSMGEQHLRCGDDLSATLRQSSLELVTSGRTATVSRPAFGAASVEDSTLGSIPVRACFGGAWIDRERGVLVGELQHACQAGGDGCIVQPTWHVVQLSAPSGSAPAESAAPAAAAPACEHGMTRFPAGVFTMGSPDGLPNERPPHVVRSASFCLDTTEVTVAGYRDCVAAKRCSPPEKGDFCNFGVAGQDRHPINCVTWTQADTYCAFRKKRLPTEAEWEYAARGPEGRAYPAGNDEPADGVCWRRRWNDGTCPVGTSARDRTPSGLLDMAGNVMEWTSSRSTLNYDDEKPLALYVVRGGEWSAALPRDLRGARRREGAPSSRGDAIGFRCASTR